MRAVVVTELGGPDVLNVQNLDRPTIEKDEVLIKTQAVSVNFADVKARQGAFPGVKGAGFIPGMDCFGIIEEAGRDVKGIKAGQRVVAFTTGGSYAEYVKAKAAVTYSVPSQVDTETAAASLMVGVTAYNVLKKIAQVQEGETVLVHAAAGGIGTTACQLAKKFGAKKVIGTVSNPDKAETAIKAGADEVINYKKEDFVKKTLELTEGKGADVILDTIAGETFDKSMECLAPFGRTVIFGHANEASLPGTVKTNMLHSSCRSVLGYSTGTCIKQRPEALEEAAGEILHMLKNGELRMHVSRTYPLEQAEEAHAHIESRKSTGKLLLII